jgi:hypothetical protein
MLAFVILPFREAASFLAETRVGLCILSIKSLKNQHRIKGFATLKTAYGQLRLCASYVCKSKDKFFER